MQAETRMDFAPVCPEQMAGFTYCYDSMNFYLLGKTCAEDGTPVLELLKSDTGVVEDVCDPVPVPDGTLDFKLTTTPDAAWRSSITASRRGSGSPSARPAPPIF